MSLFKNQAQAQHGAAKLEWKPRRKYKDHRDNAAIIIEFSNVCPFRWKRGIFTCGFCPLTFQDFDDLRTHTAQHPNRVEAMHLARSTDFIKIDVSDLKCVVCFQKFTDVNTFKEHLILSHNKSFDEDQEIGVIPFIIGPKDFSCTQCADKFQTFVTLNSHMNDHYQYNICCQCGKSFSVAHRLKAHMATHDSHLETEFKCSKCPKTFSSRLEKNAHLSNVHEKILRYKCPICGVTFKSYSTRVKHMRENHNRKLEYACHLCPAVFSMCNRRTKHIQLVHIKEKKFSCNLCSYECVVAAQLKRHMVRHSTERKFECGVCKKTFPRRKSLNEHLKIHNNDKRFACEFCGYTSIQKSTLKSHLKAHHSNDLNTGIV